MAKYLSNKIWIVFLPAHISHILQPCDLGFFPALKPNYRRKLQLAYALYMESFPGKPEFLNAYSRVRNEVIKSSNIKAGWEATGIYPRNRLKALNNRYVKINATPGSTFRQPVIPVLPIPDFAVEFSPMEFSTPKSSRDVFRITEKLRKINPNFGKPIARQLFAKLDKGLNAHIINIFSIETRNEFLEQALEKTRPKKRKKVLPAPNEKFVRIANVIRIRRSMPGYMVPDSDDNDKVEIISGNETPEVTKECIIVALMESEKNSSLDT
jgi:hypothetical protein